MKNFYNEAVINQQEENYIFYRGKIMQRKTDTSLLKFLENNHQEGNSVLDYGAGTGRLLQLMIDKNMNAAFDYKYYDHSEAAKNKFIEKFKDYENNIVEKLDDKYDYVIANDILTESNSIQVFKEKLEELTKLANKAVLFHFWISKNKKSIHKVTKNQGVEFDNFWISKTDLIDVLDLSESKVVAYDSEEDLFTAIEKSKLKVTDQPLEPELDIFEWRIQYDDNGRPWKTCFLAITKNNQELRENNDSVTFNETDF